MEIYNLLPEIDPEEQYYLKGLIGNFSDEKKREFAVIYRNRRKDPQTIMLLSILGFFGFAGIHRFMLDQIGMGLLYLFTGGLCLVGTIIDLTKYKKLAFDYNRIRAQEAAAMVGPGDLEKTSQDIQ